MKVLRIILNILGTLLAVFFSLVTFLTLLLTPAISTGTGFNNIPSLLLYYFHAPLPVPDFPLPMAS